ncbi:MAG: hypothetical protein FWF82_00865 [Oscillospiraceae bacterium]|nr:hypothetical protein [Oscillospiraceae bacterium]
MRNLISNKKSVLVKIISLTIVLAVMAGMMFSVFAKESYISYGYDWYGDTYPVQSGYVVGQVITSNELGLDVPLSKPEDIFLYQDEYTKEITFFIVDSGNNRIIICDEDFGNVRILDEFFYGDDYQVENFVRDVVLDEKFPENNVTEEMVNEIYWAEVEKVGTKTTLKDPKGIHVTKKNDELRLYIADYENGRVISTGLDGSIFMEYNKPTTATYSVETFSPSKVLTDNADNVYICVGIDKGAVRFNDKGEFKQFYGANRVTRTADAILNYFLRFILSREQMENRTRPVPVQFSNFTIDSDQFIYTVTATRRSTLDIVTKLDPSGRNVFAQQGYDNFTWGDFNEPYIYGKQYSSVMIDISVDHNGNIYLFDYESGKIFQYDKEGYLMFIFGGKGEQKGLFVAPTALETHEGKVYALDSVKNSITIFHLTEFGGLVVDAMDMFNRGLYADSLGPWEEVLRRDANYYMAYVGMGNAKLSIGEFDKALEYFHMHSWQGYNMAFKDFRINYIRNNFNKLLGFALIAIGVVVAAAEGIRILQRKRKPYDEYEDYVDAYAEYE